MRQKIENGVVWGSYATHVRLLISFLRSNYVPTVSEIWPKMADFRPDLYLTCWNFTKLSRAMRLGSLPCHEALHIWRSVFTSVITTPACCDKRTDGQKCYGRIAFCSLFNMLTRARERKLFARYITKQKIRNKNSAVKRLLNIRRQYLKQDSQRCNRGREVEGPRRGNSTLSERRLSRKRRGCLPFQQRESLGSHLNNLIMYILCIFVYFLFYIVFLFVYLVVRIS